MNSILSVRENVKRGKEANDMIQYGNETLYTRQEVADMLGFSYDSIRYRVKAGQIRSRKIGGDYYISKRDLDEFIKGKVVVES